MAVGLSAGFIEPLEASALVLIELSAAAIADHLPHDRATMSIVAKRFNGEFSSRWEQIIDFLKLTLCLLKRTDSPSIGKIIGTLETVPMTLQENLTTVAITGALVL